LLRRSDVQQARGSALKAISKLTGYDRKTVRKYLLKPETVPHYGPRLKRPRQFDAHKPYLQNRMKAGVWNAGCCCGSFGNSATKAATRL